VPPVRRARELVVEPRPDKPDFKERQSLAWGGPAAGYHSIAQEVQPLAERLLEVVRVTTGDEVLDAAAGTGITAMAAARRGGQVTALDFAAPLLEAGQLIAERGLHINGIEWVLGDVEQMPFPDARFDVVVSTVGVIFAPDHRHVARELQRVLHPGGRLGLACAKPEGTVGRLNAVRSRYVSLPSGVAQPHDWGKPGYVRHLLSGGFTDITFEDAWFPVVAGSAEEARDRWLAGFGPMRQAYEGLAGQDREALRADLLSLFREFEVEGIGMVMPREAIIASAIARG
jgi:SAM-dependent methyltransferase